MSYQPSPEELRARARIEWDAAYSRTCGCPWHEGVRLESDGAMRCGACDRPIVVRRRST